IAHDRGGLTTGLYERRLTCLARAEASLVATADLAEHATAASFPDARVAVGSLADPALCARVDESLVPLPPAAAPRAGRRAAAGGAVRGAEAAIERARILATAARPESPQVAAQARALAEASGYAPVVARAVLVEGRARMWAEDPAAGATLEDAMRRAFAAHDD